MIADNNNVCFEVDTNVNIQKGKINSFVDC